MLEWMNSVIGDLSDWADWFAVVLGVPCVIVLVLRWLHSEGARLSLRESRLQRVRLRGARRQIDAARDRLEQLAVGDPAESIRHLAFWRTDWTQRLAEVRALEATSNGEFIMAASALDHRITEAWTEAGERRLSGAGSRQRQLVIEKGLVYLAGSSPQDVALGARLILEASPPHLPVATCLELQKLQSSHSGEGAWLTTEDRLPDGTRDAKPEWLTLPSPEARTENGRR